MKGILKKTWDNNWFIEYWSTENSHSEIKIVKVCPEDSIYCFDVDNNKSIHFQIMTGVDGECAVFPPFVSDDFQIGPDGAYEHE
jgi:hypothetical protein